MPTCLAALTQTTCLGSNPHFAARSRRRLTRTAERTISAYRDTGSTAAATGNLPL